MLPDSFRSLRKKHGTFALPRHPPIHPHHYGTTPSSLPARPQPASLPPRDGRSLDRHRRCTARLRSCPVPNLQAHYTSNPIDSPPGAFMYLLSQRKKKAKEGVYCAHLRGLEGCIDEINQLGLQAPVVSSCRPTCRISKIHHRWLTHAPYVRTTKCNLHRRLDYPRRMLYLL
jgi:hypothetical protein